MISKEYQEAKIFGLLERERVLKVNQENFVSIDSQIRYSFNKYTLGKLFNG